LIYPSKITIFCTQQLRFVPLWLTSTQTAFDQRSPAYM